MKIIFNHTINDWWGQIYDEWNRNHEIILPENYKKSNVTELSVDLNSLEEIAKKNLDASFIFGFHGDLSDLIKWQSRNIKIPFHVLQDWLH